MVEIDEAKFRAHYENGLHNLILELKTLGNVPEEQVNVIVEALEHLRDDDQCCNELHCKLQRMAKMGMLITHGNVFDRLIRETVDRVFRQMNDDLMGILMEAIVND